MKNLLRLLSIVTVIWLAIILWDAPTEFFFLNKKTRLESLPTADSYMKNTETTKFDINGNKAYFLTSDTGLYYTAEDRFELDRPKLEARKSPSGGKPWQLTATTAHSSRRGQEVTLRGNVHAWQVVGEGKNEFFTPELTFMPEQNIATTTVAVKFLSPQGVTTAVGMNADLNLEVYRLLSQVESKYHGR